MLRTNFTARATGFSKWAVACAGPGGGFTDTLDTAADIVAQINAPAAGFVPAGQTCHLRICNQTGATETLGTRTATSANGTIDLLGTPCIPGGTGANFAIDVINPGNGTTGGTLSLIDG